MSTQVQTKSNSKLMTIIGWVLTLLPVAMLCMSAFMKLSRNPQAVDGFHKAGYPDKALLILGIIEVACTVIYLIPNTAMLGAILLTGYLGGAVNHHVQAGDAMGKVLTPAILGVVLWLGLYLRDSRVRALAPLRCL